MKKSVGILIFNDAEVLDFAGPFEVFSVASEVHDFSLFEVFTIAQSAEAIVAVNGLSVNPKYSFENCPHIDILIIAGGNGTNQLVKNQATLDWVKSRYESVELLVTICSATRVLAKLNLLEGRPYCTHNLVYEHMSKLAPLGIPQPDKRFVQTSDKVYTSGGISAGIDLSFHIVEQIYGEKVAKATAEYMEYRRVK